MHPDSRSGTRDEGSAMILVLMALVLVTALTATLATVTISNLVGSRRAQEAGKVLSAAEAGVAQALTYMRANGVGGMLCSAADATSSADCQRPYGSGRKIGPAAGSAAGATYAVWVEEVAHFSPRTRALGVYLIHSTGTLTNGSDASRSVTAKVQIDSLNVPHGVIARDLVRNGNGTPQLTNQSIFTGSCFVHRDQLNVSGTDPFLDIPSAVHSSAVITIGGENSCDPGHQSEHKAIHADGPCNAAYPNDQDIMGGVLGTTSACAAIAAGAPAFYGPADPAGSDAVYGSRIESEAGMRAAYGVRDTALTADEVERLRKVAEDAGTLTSSTTWPTVSGPGQRVFFFDLTNLAANQSREVELDDVPALAEDPCNPPIVVIRDGNAVLHTGGATASVFMVSTGAAYGTVNLNGGTLTGSLVANTLNLGGNVVMAQQDCAADNINAQLLDISVTSYSEDD